MVDIGGGISTVSHTKVVVWQFPYGGAMASAMKKSDMAVW